MLSAEAYSKHGFNVSGVIFDELHTQPNRALFDVMTKGSGDARTQPLYFLITTAGTDTHSVCFEQHQKAKDLLAGKEVDPTFYPVVYGADPEDDWLDENVWRKANPSLGVTVPIDKVRATAHSARINPAEENSFRQLRLNQWVKQSIRWTPMHIWNQNNQPVDLADLEGRVLRRPRPGEHHGHHGVRACVSTRREHGCVQGVPWFWIPEEGMTARVNRDRVPYDLWAKKGLIQVTDGNVVHYGAIEAAIEELGERFNIRQIAFDRWGATQMSQNLEDAGFTVVPFGQGFKDMSPPSKEFMKLALEGRLHHGGNEVLAWMVDNIHIRADPAGNIKPDIAKSTEKIDGVVATIMALDRAIRNGGQHTESVCDSGGLLVL